MFERFTDRARRAVVLAQEEARDFDHAHIGTEHLLLGLLREGEGLASSALTAHELSLETVRAEVERRVGRGVEAPKGQMPFSPRAKKVLELALREALRLGHNYIGTEHILLALLREGEGVAAQILMTQDKLGLDAISSTLIELMGGAAALKVTLPAAQIPEGLQKELRKRIEDVSKGLRSVPMQVTIGDPTSEDEVRKRLEAIEARLSVIEQLLRDLRGEEAG